MTYSSLKYSSPLGHIQATHADNPNACTVLAPGTDAHADAEAGLWGAVEDYTGPSLEQLAEQRGAKEARQKRDRLLAASDFAVLPDTPTDTAAWAAYRQALRDVTRLPGFPSDITWPVPPKG